MSSQLLTTKMFYINIEKEPKAWVFSQNIKSPTKKLSKVLNN